MITHFIPPSSLLVFCLLAVSLLPSQFNADGKKSGTIPGQLSSLIDAGGLFQQGWDQEVSRG